MKDQQICVQDSKALLTTIRALTIGGMAILPTDTLYGIHGLATMRGMAGKMANLKGYSDESRGLILLAKDMAMVGKWADLGDKERDLIEAHSPGAVSYILPAAATAPDECTTESEDGLRRIAFRIPDSGFLQDLMGMLEMPLLSTSANMAGEPTLESGSEIVKLFTNKVDLIVTDPDLESRVAAEGAQPSTLVDLSCHPYKVVREGKVPFNLALKAAGG
ncbi:MAG: L-threonylcarbamoyladenylate synthase [bacterium]|nr:L-threonylcarbamoyladenylate synthase [bacterium]